VIPSRRSHGSGAAIAAEAHSATRSQRCLAGGSAIAIEFCRRCVCDGRGRPRGTGRSAGLQRAWSWDPSSRGQRGTHQGLVDRGVREGRACSSDGRKRRSAARGRILRQRRCWTEVAPESTLATTGVQAFSASSAPAISTRPLAHQQRPLRRTCPASSRGSGKAARRSSYEGQVRQRRHQRRRRAADGVVPLSAVGRQLLPAHLHAHGHHAIEFFAQTKVVVERWP
jgi:malonate-semialdehyde dehydrogenase (acetylating)/methylmalonate-semialdehyde dehydrogenase